jgi:hypothetical protein
MYLRQNAAQELIGDARDTSQPTISRYLAVLVSLVKSALEEFVPSAADAIEVVNGRVVLVDGTLTPAGPTKSTRRIIENSVRRNGDLWLPGKNQETC